MSAQDPGPPISERVQRAAKLLGAGDLAGAEALLREVLSDEPGHSGAVQMLAAVLDRSGRTADAESILRYHLAARPDDAVAQFNLGEFCRAAGKLDEAVERFRHAAQLAPLFAEAHYSLAGALVAQGQLQAAIEAYRKCLELRPDWIAVRLSLADALAQLGDYTAAIEHYKLVPSADASDVDRALGHAYQAQGRIAEARAAYERHARGNSRDGWLAVLGAECLCEPVAPDAAAIDATYDRIAAAVDQALKHVCPIDPATLHASAAEPPMALTYYGTDVLPIMSQYAQLFAGAISPGDPKSGQKKPRVGVVVTPGHEGVFARCLGRLFERISRQRLDSQIVCSRASEQALRQMLPGTSLEFFTISPRIDETAARIRAAQFDLLYYWECGTDAINYFLPYFKPAPLQVASWGWPATTGNPHVSHYCSAQLLEPSDGATHYSERLVQFGHLPTWYERPSMPHVVQTRADFGFGDREHLYLCIQNVRKYHPDFDPLLAEILRRDSLARLAIIGDAQPAITEALVARFRAAMPDVCERVQVLPRMSRDVYMSVLGLADVVLDTLHYGGGANTVLDACAVGTPIVTLPGRFQRGRWTQAVFRMLGISEMIVANPSEYVQSAVEVASNSDLCQSLRDRILAQGELLFESQRTVVEHEEFFVRTIEDARAGRL